jgi:hypothetical protein
MPRKREPAKVDEPASSIPLDAGGVPVFLILPAVDQKWYDRHMKSCEAGWQATQDPFAVAEAQTLTFICRQVLPAWLDEAVWLLACKRRTKGFAKRAQESAIRFTRFSAVKAAHAQGMKWAKAKDHAETVLAGTDAAADAGTIWKAYCAVRKDIKAGRFGRYFVPKPQRHRKPLPKIQRARKPSKA